MPKRPQYKDLFQAVGGRPQAQPQAGTQVPGVSPSALNNTGSYRLKEMADFLGNASGAAADWAEALGVREKQEGEEEGYALAMAAKRQGIGNLLKVTNNAVKRGFMSHGMSPFTLKSLHKNAGILFAQDPSTFKFLNEGVDDYLAAKIESEDLNWNQVEQQLMAEVVTPKLEGLIDQLPNSQLARDIGFSGAIVPVMDKLKANWAATYEAHVDKKNTDYAKALIDQHLESGDYASVFEIIKPYNKDPKNEEWSYAKALGINLNPAQDHRKLAFNQIKNWIQHDVVAPKNLGSYHTASVHRALSNLDEIMAITESGSGAKVGNYTDSTGNQVYSVLRQQLIQNLITAQNTERENEEKNRDETIKWVQNLVFNNWKAIDKAVNGEHPPKTSLDDEVVKVKDPETGEENWQIKTTKTVTPGGINHKFVADPSPYILKIIDMISEGGGGLLNPSTGEPLTKEDIPAYTQLVLKDHHGVAGIRDALKDFNQYLTEHNKNKTASYEQALKTLNSKTEIAKRNLYKNLMGHVGPKWNQTMYNKWFDLQMQWLEQFENESLGVLTKRSELRSKWLTEATNSFKHTFVGGGADQRGIDQTFLKAVSDNLESLSEMTAFELESEFTGPEYEGVNKSLKERIQKNLLEGNAQKLHYYSLSSPQSSLLFQIIRDDLTSRDIVLKERLRENPFDSSTLTPQGRAIYGSSGLEANFIREQQNFMQGKWSNIVDAVWKHFDNDAAQAKAYLEVLVRQKDGELVLPARGNKEAVILNDGVPLSKSFDDHVKTLIHPKTGEPYKSWSDWATKQKADAALLKNKQ